MVRVLANRFEIAFWGGFIHLMENSRLIQSIIRWIYQYTRQKDFLWIPALLLVWMAALVFTGVVVGNAILH